ncbi:hypothetical protein CesoFtcFv8_021606 [Champsocephalus esox]|uniref:Uncharacterized protein n=1 Tax=Champsocephalus esox TaxID=159716 RepID=A0AAN8B9T2_9TELE|nr:hypothetical protein CesoFtcFv8_021606 [Champsocephalus esox]
MGASGIEPEEDEERRVAQHAPVRLHEDNQQLQETRVAVEMQHVSTARQGQRVEVLSTNERLRREDQRLLQR